MEVRIDFGHREWWLRRRMWWFAGNISGIRNIISKSSYGFRIPLMRINDRCHFDN
jgi:hypothetical protein